jgi:hypothetical protein
MFAGFILTLHVPRTVVAMSLPFQFWISVLSIKEGRIKGKVHPRTGHEGPQGE